MASTSLSRGSPSQQAHSQIMEYGKITLSELLMEQQEPFLLEEYLKQNGYSRRVPKKKCHPQRTGLCGSLSVCKKLLKRRPSSSSSRGTNAGGSTATGNTAAPRSVLNKMMYRKVISRLMNWGCGGRQQMEFRRLDSDLEKDYNNGEEHDDWGKMEVTSRQLSPVSVFELHSDVEEEDSSSPSYHYTSFEDKKMSTSSRDSEQEAEHQVSTYSPIKNNCTNMEPNQNALAKDVQEMIWEPQEGLRSQMSSKQAHEQVLSWEKIARDINQIPNLIEIDFSRSEKQWCQVRRDMAEIGGEIETLIFEDIRKEAVLDLLGFGSYCTL